MRAAGVIGVVLALGAAYFIYGAQVARSVPAGSASPQEQIDVTGIRASLLEIGQAQRIYLAAHGAYGTLDELRADGAPHLGADARGYAFDVRPNGAQGFTATARPVDPSRAGRPTLELSESMQVTSR